MVRQRIASEQRREEIIQTALSILHHKGVGQLTLRELARANGISEAAVYRHFRSKEDIVHQLTAVVFQAPQENQTRQGVSQNVKQRLYQIMAGQFGILEANPYITSVLFQDELFRQFPAIRKQFDKHHDAMCRRIEAAVVEGQQEGLWRTDIDPQTFIIVFVGAMRQLVSNWRADNFGHSLSQRSDRVFSLLMDLLER